MKKYYIRPLAMCQRLGASAILLSMISLAHGAEPSPAPAEKTDGANPLLKESTLQYQYPLFDQIKNEHFQPAIEAGMAEELKEIEKIANDPAKPTFENTVVAMEKSGELLNRADRIFSNLNASNTNPTMQKIDKELSPKLSAHQDAIRLNGPLFKRIESLYEQRDKLGLDAESKFLLERYYKDFVRAGAKLSDADKEKLKAMNSELATLQTKFAQNVLEEKNASSIVVDDKAELDGLSENAIAAAAKAAKEEGKEGKYVIRMMNTTGQPPLDSLKNRALRQRIMETSMNRNSHGGEWDNRETVARIAKLRAERAALAGLPESRGLSTGRADREDGRDRERHAGENHAAGGGECAQGNCRHAGGDRQAKRRLQARGLGLGFLRRAGAEGALRFR